MNRGYKKLVFYVTYLGTMLAFNRVVYFPTRQDALDAIKETFPILSKQCRIEVTWVPL